MDYNVSDDPVASTARMHTALQSCEALNIASPGDSESSNPRKHNLQPLTVQNMDATLHKNVSQRICNRGPDYNQTVCIENDSDSLKVNFLASVLWMQGSQFIKQPLEDNNGILLYNGDIFDDGLQQEQSDTQHIMNELNINILDNKHILKVIKSIKGPFSMVYFNKAVNEFYFTRDRTGRTSLLINYDGNSVIISSVLGRDFQCIEIPASHIYSLNISTKTIKSHSWIGDDSDEHNVEDWMKKQLKLQALPDEEYQFNMKLGDELGLQDGIVDYIDQTLTRVTSSEDIMSQLLINPIIKDTVQSLISLLDNSVRRRLQTQPNKCKKCIRNPSLSCNHCTAGILFSGGLDCTILAFLADKHLPKDQPIDLLNVAFKKDENATYDVPDRVTGKRSFEELKQVCGSRKWIFKEINVPMEEVQTLQRTRIADLVHPRQTILDESLGTALWFAARGQTEEDCSQCRVLLLGSGADELFGGYTRHRNAFRRQGWSGLESELMLDWSRISFRNLARDNRVICDHGRQPRMPYLDEDFVDFVLKLRPWLKCYPSDKLGPGIGDKLMLRLVAFELGTRNAATLPKRALQFGSRIANKKERGNDISKNFSCR